jgi:hypothetical protein
MGAGSTPETASPHPGSRLSDVRPNSGFSRQQAAGPALLATSVDFGVYLTPNFTEARLHPSLAPAGTPSLTTRDGPTPASARSRTWTGPPPASRRALGPGAPRDARSIPTAPPKRSARRGRPAKPRVPGPDPRAAPPHDALCDRLYPIPSWEEGGWNITSIRANTPRTPASGPTNGPDWSDIEANATSYLGTESRGPERQVVATSRSSPLDGRRPSVRSAK